MILPETFLQAVNMKTAITTTWNTTQLMQTQAQAQKTTLTQMLLWFQMHQEKNISMASQSQLMAERMAFGQWTQIQLAEKV